MRILRVLLAFVLVVAGVVSTVGSGGGGGGSSSGGIGSIGPINLAPGPLPDLDITIANAQEVSATVVQAINQLLDVAAKIGGQIFPSPPAAPDLLSSNSKFELIAAANESVTEPCAVNGTVRVSGRPENDPVSLSVGDAFDLMFDTCDDGDGYTLDGRFDSVLVSELEGDPRTDVFRLRYKFLSMSLTVASDEYSYLASSSGQQFVLDWDSLSFPEIVLTATPGLLHLSSLQAYSYYWPSQQAGENSLTVNADISIPTTQVDARATVMRSNFLSNDLVSYEILVPLQAPDGQDPELGEILVSADTGNGTVRIVIESGTTVRLEIDSDGDGTVDDYQYTTWAALQG